ncbi:DUF3107 domain-containing protein [Nocardioides euryhalodurans]|uniref:DUF3107 domain-containing protein n=1 Tax=Nocardioides euryhalodurans TaxID=2518370 RepID=A0A4P7GJI7_9ACTN|nr:DUF3107 domain-containing protein [Nocardioides euryhalodurans]QBR91929.1 DUF3107 domain-containing protein [Nocardioides euryhalodurans]
MEIKIGVQHVTRELVLETNESSDDVQKKVAEAVSGSGDGILSLVDTKGRQVLIPAAKLAYIEIGGGVTGQVGFRS